MDFATFKQKESACMEYLASNPGGSTCLDKEHTDLVFKDTPDYIITYYKGEEACKFAKHYKSLFFVATPNPKLVDLVHRMTFGCIVRTQEEEDLIMAEHGLLLTDTSLCKMEL